MMTLVFMACLVQQPSRCHAEVIPFANQNMSLDECLDAGPSVLDQWQKKHPTLFFTHWACQKPEDEEA